MNFPESAGNENSLLKKFGSIQRLRLATVEQIAQVSGFGGKAAVELKAFIEARSTPAAQVNQSADGSDRNST
jgi:DNA repair protein RadC